MCLIVPYYIVNSQFVWICPVFFAHNSFPQTFDGVWTYFLFEWGRGWEAFCFVESIFILVSFFAGFKISELQLLSLSALKVLVCQSLAPSIVKIQVSVFFFWPRCAACRDLGIELAPLAMKVWSPNHWTAWEFLVSPVFSYFVVISLCLWVLLGSLFFGILFLSGVDFVGLPGAEAWYHSSLLGPFLILCLESLQLLSLPVSQPFCNFNCIFIFLHIA